MATFKPAASADDANEVVSGGAMNLTNDGNASATSKIDGTNHAGFRFPNVTVAQGATIASAIFKFDQLNNYTGSGNLDHTTIYGENVNSSAQFTTTTSNISGRARTTANKASNTIGADNTTWVTGSGVDMTAIVQEIINRAGWTSGSALSILFIGDGTAGNFILPYMWDYFSGFYFANLIITTGGGGIVAETYITPVGLTQAVNRAGGW